MIKYYDVAVTFSEFPDETALCINISNCPCHCSECSEPWLREDVGSELTEESLKSLIASHPGVTLIGIMGGDCDHAAVVEITKWVHDQGLLVGMYSGLDQLDMDLLNSLDYYKIGRWIMPQGDVADWWKTNCGPLKFTFSNQLMFKRINNNWVNITYKFREKPLNNLKREII